MEAKTVEETVEALGTDGIVIIPDVFSQEQIKDYRASYDRLERKIESLMSGIKPRAGEYKHQFGAECTLSQTPTYTLEDGTVVIKLAPGRLDFSHEMDQGLFADPSFHEPPVLRDTMRALLCSDFSHYNGALVSKSKSSVGPWHRDTRQLFGSEETSSNIYF